MKKLSVVLLALFCHNVNAEWGQQWGSMVWGQSSTNVPMMGGFGQLIFFGLLLVIGVFVTKRWGLIKTLPAIALLSLIPLVVDADEIELNSFQNGSVADANKVNENFNNLKTAIESVGGLNGLTTRTVIFDGIYTTTPTGFIEALYIGSVACNQTEQAISGGCKIEYGASHAPEIYFLSNYTEGNEHYCKLLNNGSTLRVDVYGVAYVNCMPL